MLGFLKDLIFPKRCVGCKKFGTYLCANCFAHIEIFQDFVCPMCLRRSVTGETHPLCRTPQGLDGLACGVVYKGIVKRLIYRLKYKPYLFDLASIIGRIFADSISQNELFMRTLSQQPIVMPIPLSADRLRIRGYNPAGFMADSISNEFKLKKYTNILKRIKSTKPQFKLNKDQRFNNVLGAFEVRLKNRELIKGKTVFLVDDLATSCATVRESAKVLKRAGAKRVYGVTFAREL